MTVDGPIMGNGDLGVVISGRPEAQRFWISKCDFWKGKKGFPGDKPNGSPCLIGGIDVSIPGLADAAYHVEQLIYEAEIKSVFSKEGSSVSMRSWVAASKNLLVIELSATGKPVQVVVNLWAQTGHESTTDQGLSQDAHWVTRKFNGPDLLFVTGAAIAMRCLPPYGEAKNAAWSFMLEPGQTVVLVASILTNHDAESYLQDSLERVCRLDSRNIEPIRKAHREWWEAFWSESFVEIGDPLIEKYYYGSQYILACCSRNKNFPPGLFGNWITTDKPAWGSDYHLNYNHQAPWWGVYSSNHVALSEPYDAPILEFIPTGKEYARRFLNCRGVYYPVGIGPRGLDTGVFQGGYTLFLGQKHDAAYAAADMFMRFYHTYDLEYAKKVYPFLLELADFWEDYLRFEPFDKLRPEDGRYVIYKSHVWEVNSWTKEAREESYDLDTNGCVPLGMVRMLFKGLLEVSEELKLNAGRREKWRHILAHISPFPMVEQDGKKRFCGAEKGPSAKVVGAGACMMHGLVWPTECFSLDSDPEILQNLLNDVRIWFEGKWYECDNGFPTMFPVAARLGYAPDEILANLRKKIQINGFPNLWIYQRGGGIETCAGTTAGINEMLLQSHGKVLRLFPVWPRESNARFGRLRAVGAFLVSSALRDGLVKYVLIESEKGRDCIVQNPWPDKKVTVYRDGRKAETMTGARFTLKTSRGERIVLGPEGVSVDEYL